MFTYCQRTGTLRRAGQFIGQGYSGHLDGKNNPSKQEIHSVGPIPCGAWEICGPPLEGTEHGPFVLRLSPKPGTETFGRSGFLIHGDMADPKLAGTASLGCIILPRTIRGLVWASGDRDLLVVAEDELEA